VGLSHIELCKAIELIGAKVIPLINEA